MARIPKDSRPTKAKMPVKKGMKKVTGDIQIARPKRGPYSLKAELAAKEKEEKKGSKRIKVQETIEEDKKEEVIQT